MLYIGTKDEATSVAQRVSQNVNRVVNVWQCDMSHFVVAYDFQTIKGYTLHKAFQHGCSVEKLPKNF